MPYDMPASAKRYYELWYKNANKQLQHPNDLDRFYFFVSIVLKFSKKKRDSEWLRKNLMLDCPEFGEQRIDKLGKIFEHVRDFYFVNRKSTSLYYWDKARSRFGM